MTEPTFDHKPAHVVANVVRQLYNAAECDLILTEDHNRIFSGGLAAIHNAEKLLWQVDGQGDIREGEQ